MAWVWAVRRIWDDGNWECEFVMIEPSSSSSPLL
jgi:hypothetical protein